MSATNGSHSPPFKEHLLVRHESGQYKNQYLGMHSNVGKSVRSLCGAACGSHDLESQETHAEGNNCVTSWAFPRVICFRCGGRGEHTR